MSCAQLQFGGGLLIAAIAAIPASPAAAPVRANAPPMIVIEVVAGDEVEPSTEVRIRITISDPDGDRITARLVEGLPWMWMEPAKDAVGPIEREIVCFVHPRAGGYWPVVIEAHDAVAPQVVVRASRQLHVASSGEFGVRCTDLDGDGQPELLVRATRDDVQGVTDAGNFCVFRPGDPPPPSGPPPTLPTAGLARYHQLRDELSLTRDLWHASAPLASDYVGADAVVVDVTGDGIGDLISCGSSNGGTVKIWRSDGGSRSHGGGGGRVADVELPARGSLGNRFYFVAADVTGDGFADLIVGDSSNATHGTNCGRVFILAGGPLLGSGSRFVAELELASPVSGDSLGALVRLGDVTGDGVVDIVASAASADEGGVADRGAVALFAGGATLVGTLTPTALLLGPAIVGSYFGDPGKHLVDLDGDGVLDLVVGCWRAPNGGEIRYWRGGAALAGTPAATAVMTDTRTKRSNRLGLSGGRGAIRFADVTNDGFLDVVAPDDGAGPTGDGLVKVFAGGPSLVGTVAPTASLGDTLLGKGGSFASRPIDLRLHDLTADGVPDLFVTAPYHTVSGVARAGAAYVFAGGSAMVGTPAPTASLGVPGATTDDRLGDHLAYFDAACTQAADVTGDGNLDLVIPAPLANEGGVVDSGALYLFAGGSGLAGTIAPTARLVRSIPTTGDRLSISIAKLMTNCAVLVDVTGDGIADVVSRAPEADLPGMSNAGEVQIWAGGATLTGTMTPTARFEGTETAAFAGDGAYGFELADLDDDGTLDLVVLEPDWGFGSWSTTNVGRAHVLAGGPSLVGTPTPVRVLEAPGYYYLFDRANTIFSYVKVQDLLFRDLDGDGRLDLIAPSPLTSTSGRVFVWSGDAARDPDVSVLEPATFDLLHSFGN